MHILQLTSNISSPQPHLTFHVVLAKLYSHSRTGVLVQPLSFTIQPSGNSHTHVSDCKCHFPRAALRTMRAIKSSGQVATSLSVELF
jgi:hypothetical protein